MKGLLTPNTIPLPFANQGDKNSIPKDATGSQLASYQEGFPAITQKAVKKGGIPPERNDFNGILYLLSQWQYAFQNGWLPTFEQDVSDAIGGYAQGAVLWYKPTTGEFANTVVPLRSLIDNNTYNFNINADYIGIYWETVGINTRVAKAGDTMSGNLTVNANITATGTISAGTKMDTVTPATSSNDTTVPTTAWVRALNPSKTGNILGVPDMNAGVSISSGTTLPCNALVVVTGDPGGYGVTQLCVDGKEVYCGGVSENSQRHKAGNVIAAKGAVITTGGWVSSLTYYPIGA